MRKMLFVLAVVSLIGFGLRTQGESARKDVTGCIRWIEVRMEAQGKVRVFVDMTGIQVFLTTDGLMASPPVPAASLINLTYAQVTAFEPILAIWRAGAAAKVKGYVTWDDSTMRVSRTGVLFNTPC